MEIRVPALGESVMEATVAQWFKSPGDEVALDEPLVELETDKVTIEVPAPAAGVLEEISAEEGANVEVGAVLAVLAGGKSAAKAQPEKKQEKESPAPAPATDDKPLAPSVRKIAAENKLDTSKIAGTGKDGRLVKADVLAALEQPVEQPPAPPRAASGAQDEAREERVKMTRLRRTIAARLKQAQNTAAMLTTFNEADMSGIMALRSEYRDVFEKKHGVRLGFMSFFVKACVRALKDVPAVNAEIDGDEIIYKNYYHIGVAVGTERGLVVPVLRDADRLGFAGVEKAIAGLGAKARDGELTIEDMQGGTFTISNGGVYGSMLSTPILNAPQSGILGMHNIQQRPIAVDGEVVIRPMMYLALSYDHRIVDGQEAVTFLVRVKEYIEDPARLTLDV